MKFNKLRLLLAEGMGTFILSYTVLATDTRFSTGTASWYIALTAGLSLMLVIVLFGHISGAHVNPAVTIAMWTLKKIDSATAIVYVSTQLLAGAIALYVFNSVAAEPLASTGNGTFYGSVFLNEAIGSAVLAIGIAAVLAKKAGSLSAAAMVGASFSIGSILASINAPGFLNPALALAHNSWDKTVVIASVIGMIAGVNMYYYMFRDDQAVQTKRRK